MAIQKAFGSFSLEIELTQTTDIDRQHLFIAIGHAYEKYLVHPILENFYRAFHFTKPIQNEQCTNETTVTGWQWPLPLLPADDKATKVLGFLMI